MDEEKKEELRKKLESFHKWPSLYMFKFIFPKVGNTESRIRVVFPESVEFILKESSNGNFVSLTVKEMVMDADTVFQRYEEVGRIEGVLAL
jgi:putative lipoic acid-binding regulatory protein